MKIVGPPTSLLYSISEPRTYVWWTQGKPIVPLQAYGVPEDFTPWDNASSKILVRWRVWLCFVKSEKGASEQVGETGVASITRGIFSGLSDLGKSKTCWNLP